jgi:hypothetical protein
LIAFAPALSAQRVGRWYIVPGAHYGTPSRTSFSLTAFRDERSGVVGKGYIITAEGGRDAAKLDVGIADVSHSVGFGLQLTSMRILQKPLEGVPNSTYAGGETHLYIGFLNLGAGVYAPIGRPSGRKGLASLTIGVGF